MGRRFLSLSVFILFINAPVVSTAQSPAFNRGVNQTNWFQVPGIYLVQLTRSTRADFEKIKSPGCDASRLPINLHHFTSGATDCIIDPLLYELIDQVADRVEELGIHLIK